MAEIQAMMMKQCRDADMTRHHKTGRIPPRNDKVSV